MVDAKAGTGWICRSGTPPASTEPAPGHDKEPDGIHPCRADHRSTSAPIGSAAPRVRSPGAPSDSRSPSSPPSAKRQRHTRSSPARERCSRFRHLGRGSPCPTRPLQALDSDSPRRGTARPSSEPFEPAAEPSPDCRQPRQQGAGAPVPPPPPRRANLAGGNLQSRGASHWTDGSFSRPVLDDFTERLASSEPVPGGGSASAVAAALGASLVSMVASLTSGKPKYVEHEPMLAWAMESGRRLSDRFLTLADDDAEAYRGVLGGIEDATRDRRRDRGADCRDAGSSTPCLRGPARVRRGMSRVGAGRGSAAGRSNPNASSDVAVAALLGEAAALARRPM